MLKRKRLYPDEIKERPEKKQKLDERRELEKRACKHLSTLSFLELENIVKKPTIITSHPPLWNFDQHGIMHWDCELNQYVLINNEFYQKYGSIDNVSPLYKYDSLLVSHYGARGKLQCFFLIVDDDRDTLFVFLPTIRSMELVCNVKIPRMFEKIICPLSDHHFAVCQDKNFTVYEIAMKDGKYNVIMMDTIPFLGQKHIRSNCLIIEHENTFLRYRVENSKLRGSRGSQPNSLQLDTTWPFSIQNE